MTVAQARHADTALLAEVLSDVERAVMNGHDEEGGDTEEETDG